MNMKRDGENVLDMIKAGMKLIELYSGFFFFTQIEAKIKNKDFFVVTSKVYDHFDKQDFRKIVFLKDRV